MSGLADDLSEAQKQYLQAAARYLVEFENLCAAYEKIAPIEGSALIDRGLVAVQDFKIPNLTRAGICAAAELLREAGAEA